MAKSHSAATKEPIIAQITALSHDGRGITHMDGKTTFVSGALPGEIVRFIVTKQRGKFNQGKVLEILEPSPQRVAPKCAHFGICGGCSLQHIHSNEQTQFKQATLLEQLQHMGGVKPIHILPPLLGPAWGYRSKARLGVKYVVKKGKVLVGFRERDARFLADLHYCHILHPSIGTKMTVLSEFIAKLDTYMSIPQLEIAVGDAATALIVRHLIPLTEKDLELWQQFAHEHGFYIYLQPGGPDTVHKLFPQDASFNLSYQIPEHHIRIEFRPTDFVQINQAINQQMIQRAIHFLQLKPNDLILDLFCGLGNFTLPLARYCARVIGVEGSETMVKQATHNANINQISNTEFYCSNLFEDDCDAQWRQKKYTKALLDPPRSGAAVACQWLAKLDLTTIVYISCNPATLARDAGLLVKHGYQLTHAGVMDMFPHTSHVESIAVFEGKSRRQETEARRQKKNKS